MKLWLQADNWSCNHKAMYICCEVELCKKNPMRGEKDPSAQSDVAFTFVCFVTIRLDNLYLIYALLA